MGQGAIATPRSEITRREHLQRENGPEEVMVCEAALPDGWQAVATEGANFLTNLN